jgi:hypothetical protein
VDVAADEIAAASVELMVAGASEHVIGGLRVVDALDGEAVVHLVWVVKQEAGVLAELPMVMVVELEMLFVEQVDLAL